MSNVLQIKDFSKVILDFTNQPDQVFVNQFMAVLNYVYTWEVANFTNAVEPAFRKRYYDITWPSGQVTYSVPAVLRNSQLLGVYNITANNTIGPKQVIGRDSDEATIFFLDGNTLQWAKDGPSSDQVLRFEYFPAAETLLLDTDIPALIPPQYHYLLSWRVAAVMKTMRSGMVPQAWLEEIRALRENMQTAMILTLDDKLFPRQLNNTVF